MVREADSPSLIVFFLYCFFKVISLCKETQNRAEEDAGSELLYCELRV